jgi:hypothetical protein
VGIAVATAVFAGTSIIPYYQGHFVCVEGRVVKSQLNWTPNLLVNSPFGGYGNVTYTLPPPGDRSGGGGSQFNGTSGSVIWPVYWNLSTEHRVLVDGVGTDARCPPLEVQVGKGPYASGLPFGGCGGCPIPVVTNTTDIGEATHVSYNSTNGNPPTWTVIWNNSFTIDNQGQISTCGGAAKWGSLTTHNLTFQVPFATGNGTFAFNETIYTSYSPIAPLGSYTASFSYWFPPNFGTWQIDNLSAPGGPGNGWAFNFVGPCS